MQRVAINLFGIFFRSLFPTSGEEMDNWQTVLFFVLGWMSDSRNTPVAVMTGSDRGATGRYAPRTKKKILAESVYADYTQTIYLCLCRLPTTTWYHLFGKQTRTSDTRADCLSPPCSSAASPISLFGPLKKTPNPVHGSRVRLCTTDSLRGGQTAVILVID